MTAYPIQHLITGLLGLFLYWAMPSSEFLTASSPDEQIVTSGHQRQTRAIVLPVIRQANVLYLGETHDRAVDHRLQTSILQSLHQSRSHLVLALEMFQRPYQSVLDRYGAGEIDLATLRQLSQYDQRWGYDWAGYAPILEFAQHHQIPLVALNTPTEITRKIARSGWEAITPEDQQWIPQAVDVRLEPDAYRQRMRQIYEQTHAGTSHSLSFDRFFLAQVLWDETMADRIATLHQQHPEALIVVLVGQEHIRYGHGIPSRVARRISGKLQQITVLLNPEEDIAQNSGSPIADYFWFTVPKAGNK